MWVQCLMFETLFLSFEASCWQSFKLFTRALVMWEAGTPLQWIHDHGVAFYLQDEVTIAPQTAPVLATGHRC